MDKVLVATLLCDRKDNSFDIALPTIKELTYPNKEFLVNVQTKRAKFSEWAYRIYRFKQSCNFPVHEDVWSWDSSWREEPRFDQDQRRLSPICVARNMCIDAATALKFDWLFFIDADVVPPLDGIEKLLELNHPYCGGYVPGRRSNPEEPPNVWYYFPAEGEPAEEVKPGVFAVHHGTLGYALIHRDIFTKLRFRWTLPKDKEGGLSEDPAYSKDVREMFGIKFWINTNAKADHILPLADQEECQW